MKKMRADPTKDLFICLFVVFIVVFANTEKKRSGSIQVTPWIEESASSSPNVSGISSNREVQVTLDGDQVILDGNPVGLDKLVEELNHRKVSLVVIDIDDHFISLADLIQENGFAISIE